MTALTATGAILALLLLLLLAPVTLRLTWRGGAPDIRVHYLVLRYDLSPGRPERKQRKREAEKKRKRKIELEGKEKKGGAKDMLRTVRQLAQSSRGGIAILRHHLVFSRVRIYVCVGGEDAHRIALTCGQLNTAALTALDIVGTLFVLRRPEVAILPDFTAPRTRQDISFRAGIRPLFAVGAAASFAYRYLTAAAGGRGRKARAGVPK